MSLTTGDWIANISRVTLLFTIGKTPAGFTLSASAIFGAASVFAAPPLLQPIRKPRDAANKTASPFLTQLFIFSRSSYIDLKNYIQDTAGKKD
jgi:hypothetical protein